MKQKDTGKNPSAKAVKEAERVLSLHPEQQRSHPSAVPADHNALEHINTYGALPDYYLDQPFICRRCGKQEIWKAKDQKWFYEVVKGHIDAKAVECHCCRKSKPSKNS